MYIVFKFNTYMYSMYLLNLGLNSLLLAQKLIKNFEYEFRGKRGGFDKIVFCLHEINNVIFNTD